MCDFDIDPTATITFTQYKRPNGRTTTVEAPIPDGMNNKVTDLLEADSTFTCEVLSTGQVAMYCDVGNTGDDDAIEICANDPSVTDALTRLIERAWNVLQSKSNAEQ